MRHSLSGSLALLSVVFAAGVASGPASARADKPLEAICSPADIKRPPFQFSPEDEAFLEEVQHGAFRYLWETGNPKNGMPPDRLSKPVVSVAGVGFLLSGLPIAVERGWVSRDQAQERAILILKTLSSQPEIRKAGLFQHFIDGETGGIHGGANLEHTVSTIDSALLFAGILTASSYFGGEVATLGDKLFEEADWTFFQGGDEAKPHERGFISLGWKPKDSSHPQGDGARLPYYWMDSGCEHRLTTFLAVCAPDESHRVDPSLYYKLRRQLGSYTHAGAKKLPADLPKTTGVMTFLPFSGSLFVNTFSHLWLNYAAMGPDNPAAFSVQFRPPVDWWENSRRATILHRIKAIENPKSLPTLGPDAWGLTASDYPKGYLVAGVYPDFVMVPGARGDYDYTTFRAKDNFGDGTIAPYGAGCAILFQPDAAMRAMRYYRSLTGPDGKPLAWRDPSVPLAEGGGFGFVDAFNLEGPDGKPWAASEYLAIDQGPLLLAIENARTGNVWKWFQSHKWVREGMDRLKFSEANTPVR
ncbi:MAG: hypothetical protein KF691_08585 [Phycisphaeraceae bacterium]|nr:hypothetical protein [Phycisphaeraceae bacterium]